VTKLPDKPTLDGIEARWAERWEADGVYRFDRCAEREAVFSIDTPPPTVSGSIHMGTIFGYTQFDANGRYQRMAGKQVFFPIGWDDNGLATERRTQNYFGVRCDPTKQYEPGFQPPFRGDVPSKHHEIPVSRPNFVALCEELTGIDEAVFGSMAQPATSMAPKDPRTRSREPIGAPVGTFTPTQPSSRLPPPPTLIP